MNTFTLDHAPALGVAVRSARKSQGLTQAELALASSVGPRFIVELEAGKASVRLDAALRVVHALGGQLNVVNLAGFEGGAA